MVNKTIVITISIVSILVIGAIVSITARFMATGQQKLNKVQQDMSRMKNDIEDIKKQLADIVSRLG